jgi:uncharacterized protein YndB with AHSA1/START domain
MTDDRLIEAVVPARAEAVWDLWTTAEGIESWWAPDGFRVDVRRLDLRPGGELVYDMTAVGAEQVAFMESAGMPVRTTSRKRFTELARPERIAYDTVVDFVPGVEPYAAATVVDLKEEADGVRISMRMQPLHDDEWTERLVMGRRNELENLARLTAERAYHGGDSP